MKKKILFIFILIVSIFSFTFSINAGSYTPEDYYMDTEMINTCNIIFNANGGSFSDSSTKMTLSQDVHLYFDEGNAIMIYPINTSVCESPSRSGYKFIGWSNNAYSSIGATGWYEYLGMDETETTINLYAVWEVGEEETFTIRFLNYDGTVLQSSTLKSGDTPSYTGETPSKPSDTLNNYAFKGWDKIITQVNGDCDYIATFSEIKIMYSIGLTIKVSSNSDMYFEKNSNQYLELYFTINESRDYTLTKSVIENILADNGYSLNFETEGYYFSGISLEDNGDLIESQTFDLSKTENITIYLNQKNELVTIRFLNYDGSVLETKTVESIKAFAYTGETPTRPSTDEGYYVFKGWNRVLGGVASDTDITAEFDYIKYYYTIRFLNHDGQVLLSSQVKNGEIPSYTGETPTKESTAQYVYTFNGWDKTLTEATCDCDYIAIYTQSLRKYIIVFLNDDGSILQDTEVEFGALPSYTGETPTKESSTQYVYTFNGWNKEITVVTANCNYTATYTEQLRTYTIKFVNYAGVELQSDVLAYGVTPSYRGETPTKPSTEYYYYEFTGWDSEVSIVTCDKTYSPVFSENEILWTVNFYSNYDTNEIISTQLVGTYKQPIIPENVVRIGYDLVGWTITPTSTEIVDVASRVITKDTDYYAVWQLKKHTVKFHLQGGDEAYQPDDQIVEYGSCPITPEEPVREGYVFVGWLMTVSEPTAEIQPLKSLDSTYIWGDRNFYAYWEVKKLTVTFDLNGGNINSSYPLVYSLAPGTLLSSLDIDFTGISKDDKSCIGVCLSSDWSSKDDVIKDLSSITVYEDMTLYFVYQKEVEIEITYLREDNTFYYTQDSVSLTMDNLGEYVVNLKAIGIDGEEVEGSYNFCRLDSEGEPYFDFLINDYNMITVYFTPIQSAYDYYCASSTTFEFLYWESKYVTIDITVTMKTTSTSSEEITHIIIHDFEREKKLYQSEIKKYVEDELGYEVTILSIVGFNPGQGVFDNVEMVVDVTYKTKFYFNLHFGFPYADYQYENDSTYGELNMLWLITDFEIIYNDDGTITYKPRYNLNPILPGHVFMGWKPSTSDYFDEDADFVSPGIITVDEPAKYFIFHAVWEKDDPLLSETLDTENFLTATYPTITEKIYVDTLDELLTLIGDGGQIAITLKDDKLIYYFQETNSNVSYLIQFDSEFNFLLDLEINDSIYEIDEEGNLLVTYYLANNEFIVHNLIDGTYYHKRFITLTSRDYGYVNFDDENLRKYYIYFNSDIPVEKFLEMNFNYKYHYKTHSITGLFDSTTNSIEGNITYNDAGSQILKKGTIWFFKNIKDYSLTDYLVTDIFQEGSYEVGGTTYNYRMEFFHEKYEDSDLGKIAKYYGGILMATGYGFGAGLAIEAIADLECFKVPSNDVMVVEYIDPLEVSYVLDGVEYQNVTVWDQVDIGTEEGNDGIAEDLTPPTVSPGDSDKKPFDFIGFINALIEMFKNGVTLAAVWNILKNYWGCCLILVGVVVVLPILSIFFPFARAILKLLINIIAFPFKLIGKIFGGGK